VSRQTEWIEPITVHARHPFSFLRAAGHYRFTLTSSDYILLQSKTDLMSRRQTNETFVEGDMHPSEGMIAGFMS
jgi:hypothetical protein